MKPELSPYLCYENKQAATSVYGESSLGFLSVSQSGVKYSEPVVYRGPAMYMQYIAGMQEYSISTKPSRRLPWFDISLLSV